MIELVRKLRMEKSARLFTVLMCLILLGSGCKRCYQCVVRDADNNDEIQWGYKEICVTKKDYEEYISICEEAAINGTSDTLSLYCDCAQDLVVE